MKNLIIISLFIGGSLSMYKKDNKIKDLESKIYKYENSNLIIKQNKIVIDTTIYKIEKKK